MVKTRRTMALSYLQEAQINAGTLRPSLVYPPTLTSRNFVHANVGSTILSKKISQSPRISISSFAWIDNRFKRFISISMKFIAKHASHPIEKQKRFVVSRLSRYTTKIPSFFVFYSTFNGLIVIYHNPQGRQSERRTFKVFEFRGHVNDTGSTPKSKSARGDMLVLWHIVNIDNPGRREITRREGEESRVRENETRRISRLQPSSENSHAPA